MLPALSMAILYGPEPAVAQLTMDTGSQGTVMAGDVITGVVAAGVVTGVVVAGA